jgi:hypothetical protein
MFEHCLIAKVATIDYVERKTEEIQQSLCYALRAL